MKGNYENSIKDKIHMENEYLRTYEDIINIDNKHRVVIPSYYRQKTNSRLKAHNISDNLNNKFALIALEGIVSVLDALAYQLAYKSIRDNNLNACEVCYDNTGRISIPKNMYTELFKDVSSVSFKPSNDKMYFTFRPNK
jgi:DNA-binding transcriptional regulator/RsmH inhibitor MraZ